MKSTIKIANDGRVVTESLTGGGVKLTMDLDNGLGEYAGVELTQGQVGALIFALAQAAEAAAINQESREFGSVGARDSVQAAEDRAAA